MFHQRLRHVRMIRRYTQQSVADYLGLSLNAYQKYEQAERSPSLDCLLKICDLFQIPSDYLLGRDSYLESLGVSVDALLEDPQDHPKS